MIIVRLLVSIALLGACATTYPQKILDTLEANRDKYANCYTRELNNGLKGSGKIGMQWEYNAKGIVHTAKATRNDFQNINLENCVVEVTKKIKFPETEGSENMKVDHAFTFREKDK